MRWVYVLGVTLGSLYVDAQGYVPALLENLCGMSCSGTCWLLGGAWFQCRYGGFWMSSYQLMFPVVRSSLVFSGFELKPPASEFQSYSYSNLKISPSPFEDNGLPFWMPDVLSQNFLWNFLSVQMFFREFVEEKVVSPSYSSVILGPPLLSFLKVHFQILSLTLSLSFHSLNRVFYRLFLKIDEVPFTIFLFLKIVLLVSGLSLPHPRS